MAQVVKKLKVANTRMTPEQYRLIEQRATKCGVTVGYWLRSIAIQASSIKPDRFGYLKVREPNGVAT